MTRRLAPQRVFWLTLQKTTRWAPTLQSQSLRRCDALVVRRPLPPASPSQACIRRVLTRGLSDAHCIRRLAFMSRQELEDGENDNYLYGVCAMQGWRTEMVRCLLDGWHPGGVAATATKPQRVGGAKAVLTRPCIRSTPVVTALPVLLSHLIALSMLDIRPCPGGCACRRPGSGRPRRRGAVRRLRRPRRQGGRQIRGGAHGAGRILIVDSVDPMSIHSQLSSHVAAAAHNLGNLRLTPWLRLRHASHSMRCRGGRAPQSGTVLSSITWAQACTEPNWLRRYWRHNVQACK